MDVQSRRELGPSLGRLVLLSYYNPYPSDRIHHFCTSLWYLLILEQFQHMGILDCAEAWFVSDRPMEFVKHGVTVRCFESFEAMADHKAETDVLWVRGKCRAYAPVLNRLAARLRVYYPASKRFLSQDWNHFDVVLVDDARQVGPVARLARGRSVARVIKTADPDVFRPIAGVEKVHDICMIGGMHIVRKNFDALIRLLAGAPSLSAVIIGKQESKTFEKLVATGARIRFIDFCGRDELNLVMNQSRVGFVPNLMDAAPRVILEFMSAGVPVLLNADILGGRDYITPRTGVLAKESEFPEVARRMCGGEISLDARGGFEAHFSPDKAAQHLGAILTHTMRHLRRNRPERPPGLLRRLVSRPLLYRRKLWRCWQEIVSGDSLAPQP